MNEWKICTCMFFWEEGKVNRNREKKLILPKYIYSYMCTYYPKASDKIFMLFNTFSAIEKYCFPWKKKMNQDRLKIPPKKWKKKRNIPLRLEIEKRNGQA